MKKNKVINLNPYHFEIKKGALVLFGTRSEKLNSQRYEIHIKFNLFHYHYLGKLIIDHLKSKKKEINQFIYNIQSR